MALSRGSVLSLVGGRGLAALATPGGGDQCPVFAVGGEHAVETGEVDAGFGKRAVRRVSPIRNGRSRLLTSPTSSIRSVVILSRVCNCDLVTI